MSKRASLASFAPVSEAESVRTVSTSHPGETGLKKNEVKYPKVSVYLTEAEVRTIKLIGLDNNQRLSDICAMAIREWLERNGHAR